VTQPTRQVDLAKPGQKPSCNPLIFFFLLKRRCFEFFLKIRIDPANLVTRSKHGTLALDQTGHQAEFKNYGFKAWKT
jgi:hypothetical protein